MSNAHLAPFMVAVTQVAPVFLDRSATLEKACELIVDAGQAGARLIVFPTAFIPGYRVWIWNIQPGEKSLLNELYGQLLANAVSIPSESTDRLCRIAQRARINVVMGMSERDTESTGTTCYNTLLSLSTRTGKSSANIARSCWQVRNAWSGHRGMAVPFRFTSCPLLPSVD